MELFPAGRACDAPMPYTHGMMHRRHYGRKLPGMGDQLQQYTSACNMSHSGNAEYQCSLFQLKCYNTQFIFTLADVLDTQNMQIHTQMTKHKL